MRTAQVQLANGRRIDFCLGAPAGAEAFFVLGVRKSGSSIMNSMLAPLGKINGYDFIDVGGHFFKQDVPEEAWRTDQAALSLLEPGHLYGGFRTMPKVFQHSTVFRDGRKILLVRDPRDALVSEYFSVAYTHTLPAAAQRGGVREGFLKERAAARRMAIEDFVIERAAGFNKTLMEYRGVLTDPKLALYFYEDVILHKRAWLADIAVHFGWHAGSAAFLDGMMGWADEIPSEERPRKFVRRVTPGDHKQKLSSQVIGRLNRILEPCMALYGYG